MKEILDIIKAYDEAVKTGRQTALATVVKIEGSSYRRPGARMLITDEGRLTGAISGGCLEGDALRKALLVMQQQKPILATYDTTDEDDAKLGVQLGCHGIVHILIEPIKENEENAIGFLKQMVAKRQDAAIATVFSLHDKKNEAAGTFALLTKDNFSGKQTPVSLYNDMQEALANRQSFTKDCEADTVLIEYVAPAISLVVFGAGNDVLPLAQMAAVLGWQITVIDGRSSYATPARFAMAQRVIVARPAEVLPQLTIDNKTAAVVMTHNYNYDLAVLQFLLPLHMPYIGVLGPKTKLQRMLDEISETSSAAVPEHLQKLHGPTGLDIGSETAEEIALSIVSEIKMVLAGSSGKPLRKKETTIHAGL